MNEKDAPVYRMRPAFLNDLFFYFRRRQATALFLAAQTGHHFVDHLTVRLAL